MFTEKICRQIENDSISIITTCMDGNGLYIYQAEDETYDLRFVASDHFDCHRMHFETIHPIVNILNAIENDLGKWKVYHTNYYGEPELCEDGLWKVPEYLTLSEYLKNHYDD